MKYLLAIFLITSSISFAEDRFIEQKEINEINKKIDELTKVLSKISEAIGKQNEETKQLSNLIEELINGYMYGFRLDRHSGPSFNP